MKEYKVRLDGVMGTKFRLIGNGPNAGDPSELFCLFAELTKKFWAEYERSKPEAAQKVREALAPVLGPEPKTEAATGDQQS